MTTPIDPDRDVSSNRVGDAGFIIGLMIIWTFVGTFNFQEVFNQVRAPEKDSHGDTAGNTAATIGAYILSAVPVFWFGYIVVYVFIHQFGMFPLISGTATKQAHAWLYFLVPIFVLGTASGTLSARPTDEMVVVIFLEHDCSSLC